MGIITYGLSWDGPRKQSIKFQSWEYDKIHYQRTAVTEFNLVCGDVFYQQGLQIGVMIGVFIGAIGFGSMSDNKGRKPCVMVALITSFFGMLLGAFAPSKNKLFLHINFYILARLLDTLRLSYAQWCRRYWSNLSCFCFNWRDFRSRL